MDRRRSALVIAGLIGLVVGGCAAATPSVPREPAPSAPESAASPPASSPAQLSPSVPAPSSTTLPMAALTGRIVFTRAGGPFGDETIFTAAADGTNELQLTENGESCCVRVSPDGRTVADDFEHRPNGLYVIDADGSNLRQVIGGNDFKREPEWFD